MKPEPRTLLSLVLLTITAWTAGFSLGTAYRVETTHEAYRLAGGAQGAAEVAMRGLNACMERR